MSRCLAVALATLFTVSACGSKKDKADEDKAAEADPSTADKLRAGAQTSAKDLRGRIGLDVKVPEPEASLATRCSLPGPPLAGTCRDEIRNIAATDSHVYLVDEKNNLRRYTIAGANADACELALDTEFGTDGMIASPPERAVPQSIDGPVHMRSGGPDFQVTIGTDDTVYFYDFLLGVYRVSGAKLEPVCIDTPGINWFGTTGKTMTILRGAALYDLKRGKKGCTTKELTIDAPIKIRGPAGYAGGALYVGGNHAEHNGSVVARIVNGKSTAVYGVEDAFAAGGLCSINAMTQCGDQVCVADGNCQEIDRFSSDGRPATTTKLRDLVGNRIYGVSGLAAAADGGLWIPVMLKTGPDSSPGSSCEGALFRLR